MKLKKKTIKNLSKTKKMTVKKIKIESNTKIIWYIKLRSEIKNKFQLERDKNKQIKKIRWKLKSK